MTETITWHWVDDRLPEAFEPVLVCARDTEAPEVYQGTLTPEGWMDWQYTPFHDVLAWARMPKGVLSPRGGKQ